MEVYRSKKHCAFTDLIFFENYYYLCFREGVKHMFSNGRIVVLRSKNGEDWLKYAESKEMRDIRDPRFIVSKKKLKILINYQHCNYVRAKVLRQEVLSWDLKKGYKQGATNKFITFVSGTKAFSYDPTTNGNNKMLNFKKSTAEALPSFRDSTEGTFLKIGKVMYYFIRRDCNDSYWLTENQKRYCVTPVKLKIDCPYLFRYKDKIYLAGRKTSRDYRKLSLHIWNDDLKCLKKIPAFGDCGYFGYANGVISYHSSYDKGKLGKTAIYVERIGNIR